MFLRDSAMTTAILSFFASAWFGWAQERPPAAWKAPLITVSIQARPFEVALGSGV